ncbi:MAG: hypothetical protein Tsb0010_19560 [Parvularculaceae bacterium]
MLEIMSLSAPGARRIALACLAGAVLAAPAAVAQADDCAVEPSAVARATEEARARVAAFIDAVDARIANGDRYGFSIAASLCGETVWREGFGYADLEHRVAVTPATKFRIGSVSKTLTAAALGRLMDQGEIDLDAEVQAYVPDFPRKTHPVTLRQLGGHLGGIRHYEGEEFLSAVHYDTVRAGLDIFENDPLVNEPGTAYHYSTYGYNLLSAAIEGAAGEDFLPFMQRAVFDAAGMADTTADMNAKIIPNRTDFYHYDQEAGEIINAPAVDNSNKWAGGGFLSTPSDLLKFVHAMFDDGLVSGETLTVLTTSQHTRDGEATNYGIGWRVDMTENQLGVVTQIYGEEVAADLRDLLDGAPILGHGGSSVGGLTVLFLIPDAPGRVAIAATSNNSAIVPGFALPAAAAFVEAARQ